MSNEGVVVPIGSLGEQNEWEIGRDVCMEENASPTDAWVIRRRIKPCPHAVNVRQEMSHEPRAKMNQPYPVIRWQVPRVIYVATAGGYDGTSLCVDCVIDAVKEWR